MKVAKLNIYAMSFAACLLTANISLAAVGTKTDDTSKKDMKALPAEVIAPASGNENSTGKYEVKSENEQKHVAKALIDEESPTSNHFNVPESVPYENSGLTGAQ